MTRGALEQSAGAIRYLSVWVETRQLKALGSDARRSAPLMMIASSSGPRLFVDCRRPLGDGPLILLKYYQEEPHLG
jgi:hypothetical protein